MTAVQARRVASEALTAIGAHKDHFVVLAALAELGPASQSDLSDRTRIFRSDLVAVLDTLSEGDWVRRTPDPADGRRNIITITRTGKRRLATLDRVLEGVNDRIMAPLTQQEREQLFTLLGKVNAHLDGPTGQPGQPGRLG
jgi:DNA-binding MarR family transcriptional regulator